MPNKEAFYMVLVDGGGQGPRVRHDTYMSATLEAERLALLTTKQVYILKTIREFHVEVVPQPRYQVVNTQMGG